jgi:hypothetical protein
MRTGEDQALADGRPRFRCRLMTAAQQGPWAATLAPAGARHAGTRSGRLLRHLGRASRGRSTGLHGAHRWLNGKGLT